MADSQNQSSNSGTSQTASAGAGTGSATSPTKRAAKKATKKATKRVVSKTQPAKRASTTNASNSKRSTPSASPAKKATKKASKRVSGPSSRQGAGRTSASKATTKKVATKKTTTTAAKGPQEIVPRNVDVRRVAGKVQALASEAARGTTVLAKEGVHVAGELASTAKTKVQSLTQKGRKFINEHPAEAAGLAAAGLTVVAAALGRKKLAPAVKGVAVAAMATKATDAVRRLVKRK